MITMSHSQIAATSQGSEQEKLDYALNNKRRVIRLVLQWASVYGEHFQEEDASLAFLEEFYVSVCDDSRVIPALKEMLPQLEKIVKQNSDDAKSSQKKVDRPHMSISTGVYLRNVSDRPQGPR
ncbi:hypothetical protein SKAU_G00235730 [Synaphobranchus kaupii]|uniref:Uncharacterized protein n=1 Tax=Synaphobranchus kaupii TaxID=118154 RepID=A0A9Q1F6G7_SYNKA|nr:hypothetical protein SKAU_G00235730 [Synaphobranchus kaupii]